MKFKKEKGSVSAKVQTLLLFGLLSVILIIFLFIMFEDRQPKEVNLNMKEISEEVVGTIPEAPILKTELLQPDKTPIENTLPIAQFKVKTPVYVGEQIEYFDESFDKDLGDTIINRHWTGKKDAFVKAGIYSVSLRVQDDQGGWSETVTHVVHVLDRTETYNLPPIAAFSATNPVYVGEEIVYEDNSYDPEGDKIINRVWEGKKATFNKSGKYRVTLKVQDEDGNWSDPLFQYIEVKDRPAIEIQRKPYAVFDVTNPVYVGQEIVYTNKSFDPDNGDSIVKVEWSANKRTSYDKPGKYTVTLRVQDNHGEWSEPYEKEVVVIDSPNMPPVADFATNSPVYVNEVVDWKNTSYDTDGVISKEQWSGDKKYMYTEAGEYNVSLIVWDDRGAQGSITKKIVVLEQDNLKPVAKFHTNSPIQEGEIAYFWDDSYDKDGKITRIEWGGDKRNSYSKEGNYEVTLTVWDDMGLSSTYTDTIEVVKKKNKAPIAQISGPQEIFVNETATFTDKSYDEDGYIVSNSWGSEYLAKTWNKAGTYSVKLEVTDDRGTKSKVEIIVYVKDKNYPLGKDNN